MKDTPFSEEMCLLSDSMGVALYQRFSQTEASLFLRCPLADLKKLQAQHKIEYLQISEKQTEFFGYQLLSYLLESVQAKVVKAIPSDSMSEHIVRTKEVQELTGLSRTTIWRLERAGKFPARLPICSGSVGWRYSEIQKWIQSC